MLNFKSFRHLTYFVLFLSCFHQLAAQEVLEQRNYIRVDQFGYLPDGYKFAVIAKAESGFNAGYGIGLDATRDVEVIEVGSGSIVYSGTAKTWNDGTTDSYSGDKGWWFDFTEFETVGSYFIRVYDMEGQVVESYSFEISHAVYDEVLRAATNMFYYQRINQPKSAAYASGATWVDTEWYAKDTAAIYLNDESVTRDISRGWIDAGDPNKYVTFAAETVHHLLTAYRENEELWSNFDLKIPESDNAVPDLLDEIKWETDWLKNMQDYPGTGGFYIKAGIKNDANYISPPSTDIRNRYFDQLCPSASIIGAGMMANAAFTFRTVPALRAYSDDLLHRAEAAWEYYEDSPNKTEECDGGEIEAGDADGGGGHYAKEHLAEATCAAVYLFALTGAEKYHDFIRQNYESTRPWKSSEWGIYRSHQAEAIFQYAFLEGADEGLAADIISKKLSAEKSEGTHYEVVERDNLYRAKSFYNNWGSNSLISRQGCDAMDFIAYGLKTEKHEKYKERSQAILNYIHGINPFGMTYLTNMYPYGAEFSATEMWHTWFATNTVYDNIEGNNIGPAPGYLVGGFNAQNAKHAKVKIGKEKFDATTGNQPAQKSYTEDNDGSNQPWAFNEPAIYYSAGYVKLLSHFVKSENSEKHILTISTDHGTTDPTSGELFAGQVQVFALGDPGYVLSDWGELDDTSNNPLTLNLSGNQTISANFEVVDTDECLIFNAGFEEGLKGWVNAGNASLSDDAYNGEMSLKISEEGGLLGGSLIAIGNKKGARLTAAAKITGQVNSAFIGINYLDHQKQVIGREVKAIRAEGYETVTLVSGVPEEVEYVQPLIWRAGTVGQVLVDDFCLTLEDEYIPPTYSLTVEGGSGDGEYEEDATVQIAADEAEPHMEFDSWEGDTHFLSNNQAITELQMPDRSVSVKANYKDILYNLNVVSGSGDGNYKFGTEVVVEAFDAVNATFDKWTGDIEYIDDPMSAVASVTIPGQDIRIEAAFTVVNNVDGSAQEVSIWPNPVRGNELEVDLGLNSDFQSFQLTDLTGAVLNQGKVLTNRFIVDLHGVKPGAYLMRLQGASRSMVYRVIKSE